MESSSDKQWASTPSCAQGAIVCKADMFFQAANYLLGPLTEPEPSQEDGPGNTFRPGATVAPIKAPPPDRTFSGRRLSKNNPYHKKSMSSTSTSEIKRSASLHSNASGAVYSSPPSAFSPSTKFSPQSPRSPSHRQEAFGENKTGRRRGSSLTERFPGDSSVRPLDILTKEKHVADRSRHATRKHHIQPDTIDNLDNTGDTAWHHGGPYDAALFARNNSTNSPLAALADSNAEALKATPKEKIIDSVQRHRPLDGVAVYPPGGVDRMGNVYDYQEGDNMMIEGGPVGSAYKRWPGVQYHPDDVKGKGEPSYSIEKALKEHKIRDESDGPEGIELKTRHRSSSGALAPDSWDDSQGQIGRSGSFSKRLSGGLKRRFGSTKKKETRDGE